MIYSYRPIDSVVGAIGFSTIGIVALLFHNYIIGVLLLVLAGAFIRLTNRILANKRVVSDDHGLKYFNRNGELEVFLKWQDILRIKRTTGGLKGKAAIFISQATTWKDGIEIIDIKHRDQLIREVLAHNPNVEVDI